MSEYAYAPLPDGFTLGYRVRLDTTSQPPLCLWEEALAEQARQLSAMTARYDELARKVLGIPPNEALHDHATMLDLADDARDAFDKLCEIEAVEDRAEKAEAEINQWQLATAAKAPEYAASRPAIWAELESQLRPTLMLVNPKPDQGQGVIPLDQWVRQTIEKLQAENARLKAIAPKTTDTELTRAADRAASTGDPKAVAEYLRLRRAAQETHP